MTNEKGFSLIQVLISAGLSGVVLLTAYSLLKTSQSMNTISGTFTALNDARALIHETFKNETAFNNTLNLPQNMGVFQCLRNNNDCRNDGGDFTLIDDRNQQVFVAARRNSNEGLTFKGTQCNNFNDRNGDDSCPFSFRVSWQPRCPPLPTSCINPVVELRATLLYRPRSSQAQEINTASYSLLYVKTNLTAKLSETCDSLGGTPGANNTCVMPFTGQCPDQNYIVGFTNRGEKICRFLRGFGCPRGQVLLGVDNNGIARCGPGCADPGSSSGSIW